MKTLIFTLLLLTALVRGADDSIGMKINLSKTYLANSLDAYDLSCAGANGRVTFAVSGLPAGSYLDGDRIVVGANSQGGNYILRIKATDASGQVAERLVNLVIVIVSGIGSTGNSNSATISTSTTGTSTNGVVWTTGTTGSAGTTGTIGSTGSTGVTGTTGSNVNSGNTGTWSIPSTGISGGINGGTSGSSGATTVIITTNTQG